MSNKDARDFLESIGTYYQLDGKGGGLGPGTSGIRLATVDPAYSSGLAKVRFDGESQVNSKGYAWVDSYTPKGGDRVFLMPVNSSFVIGGLIQTVRKSPVTSLQYMEFASTVAFSVSGSMVNWDMGPLPIDNNATLNGAAFAKQGTLSGSIDFLETGLYTVSSITIPNSSPGTAGIIAKLGGGSVAAGTTTGNPWELSTTATFRATAGDNLRYTLLYTTARTQFSRVRILKHP